MKQKIAFSLSRAAVIATCSTLALVVNNARAAPADAPLPADAGRNIALNRAATTNDPNVTGWDRGLTDGSWETNSTHTFATGKTDSFPKTVTVDLEKPYMLSHIRLGVPDFGATKTIQVALSVDGQQFAEVGSYVFSQSKVESHLFTFKPTSARYVRLTYPDHFTEQVAYSTSYVFTTEFEAYAPTDLAAQKEEVRPPAVSAAWAASVVAPVTAAPTIVTSRPNLALGKSYVVSDPNLSDWGTGLTNGSWEPNSEGTFATGKMDAFPKTATVDLGQATAVGYVVLGVPAFGSTKTVEVALSTDGQTFTPAGSYVFPQGKVENHLYTLTPVQARYVRLTYPDHYAEQVGYPVNFAFTTEVEVYPPGNAPSMPVMPVAPVQAAPRSASAAQPPLLGWPAEVKEATYQSAADDTLQPTLYYFPKSKTPAPLLVALHTWGGNYQQEEPAYAKWCIARGWAFVHPDFRGANTKPQACGSELVVKDILSAVDYARKTANIDSNRIYLVGVSGGGYAAMLMAGRAPEIWAGVSAWCGISDLKQWHTQSAIKNNRNYVEALEKVCGGPPGESVAVDEEYRKRSAITWLSASKGVPLDLNTGIFDGHQGSVPTSQSLQAYNLLATPTDRIADEDIAFITEKAKIPTHLQQEINDPLYQSGKVLLRKVSGKTRVTVFEGGHTILPEAALNWLEKQRKGQPAIWDFEVDVKTSLSDIPTEAGK